MMKILFISGCYSAEAVVQIRSKCRGGIGIQNAPNAFQWSIIKGLSENKVVFDVLSFPLLPVFPLRYKRPFSPNRSLEYDGCKIGGMYRYCTAIGIKPLSINWRLRRQVEKRLKLRPVDEETVLLLYSTNSWLTKAVIPLTQKYAKVTIAAIITDLIDDAFNYQSNNTFLKKIQIKREIKAQKESYESIDKFVLLTKAMEEKIPEAVGKNIVVEGICDRSLDDAIPQKVDNGVKSVLYTGTLQKYVGINDFVDAFSLTKNPNYRFIICGAGRSESYIKEKAENDSRIVYKGVVPRETALELQQQATIVVNPRKPTEDITRFSFPSKTIEYLSSGTPMIGYHLEGIPDEYYPHYYSPEDLSNESMAKLIDEVLAKPKEELEEKAKRALRFIKENKNAKSQVAKIIEFLK